MLLTNTLRTRKKSWKKKLNDFLHNKILFEKTENKNIKHH
jgi:hypothetical protein